MDYYIYLTTNTINGKQYIGQHKGRPDDNYFGSGTTILKAIKKYGKENFTKEILCFCETREEADKKEREYIQLYNAIENKNFYNNGEKITLKNIKKSALNLYQKETINGDKNTLNQYNRI